MQSFACCVVCFADNKSCLLQSLSVLADVYGQPFVRVFVCPRHVDHVVSWLQQIDVERRRVAVVKSLPAKLGQWVMGGPLAGCCVVCGQLGVEQDLRGVLSMSRQVPIGLTFCYSLWACANEEHKRLLRGLAYRPIDAYKAYWRTVTGLAHSRPEH